MSGSASFQTDAPGPPWPNISPFPYFALIRAGEKGPRPNEGRGLPMMGSRLLAFQLTRRAEEAQLLHRETRAHS